MALGVGLVALIFWELRHRNPVVNFRVLNERNFAACCVIIFCAYLALFAGTKSLLGLLQALFGYDALKTGLVMSPSGIFAVLAMPIVGRLIGLKVDTRWLIAAGLLLMTAGNYWMSQLNLDISPSQAIWPRVVLVVGLSVCFAPANVAAYLYTPLALRGAAIGLLSLLRNEGGSVGVSLSQTFQERRDQFHVLRLGEYLRSPQRGRSSLSRAGSSVLRSTEWRSSRVPAIGGAATRKPASAAGVFACLFRHLLDGGCADVRGRVLRPDHETVGGRESRPRSRMRR